jgi:RNA polymerase sigma factor (sigma-70 family)
LPDDSQARTSVSLLQKLRHDPADQAAWSAFVDRYAPAIYNWCQAWELQQADAEDVTQRVLQQLASVFDRFSYDPSRSFRAWLKTLTRHAWSDLSTEQQHAGLGSGDTAVVRILQAVEARENLEQRLEGQFDRELLEEASARIRSRVEPRTWEAFRLIALEGKSGAEAARAIGVTVATAFKARSNVQKLLREEISRLEGDADTPPCS